MKHFIERPIRNRLSKTTVRSEFQNNMSEIDRLIIIYQNCADTIFEMRKPKKETIGFHIAKGRNKNKNNENILFPYCEMWKPNRLY